MLRYVRTFEEFRESPEYIANKMFKDFEVKLKDMFTSKSLNKDLKLEEINISTNISSKMNIITTFIISSETNSAKFTLYLNIKNVYEENPILYYTVDGYDLDFNNIKSISGDITFDKINNEWLNDKYIESVL